jgi:serine/threonine protein kinase
MKRLSHPHVVAVQAVFVEGGHMYVQMPLYAGGDMRAWLAAARRSEAEVLEAAKEVEQLLALVLAVDEPEVATSRCPHTTLGGFL